MSTHLLHTTHQQSTSNNEHNNWIRRNFQSISTNNSTSNNSNNSTTINNNNSTTTNNHSILQHRIINLPAMNNNQHALVIPNGMIGNGIVGHSILPPSQQQQQTQLMKEESMEELLLEGINKYKTIADLFLENTQQEQLNALTNMNGIPNLSNNFAKHVSNSGSSSHESLAFNDDDSTCLSNVINSSSLNSSAMNGTFNNLSNNNFMNSVSSPSTNIIVNNNCNSGEISETLSNNLMGLLTSPNVVSNNTIGNSSISTFEMAAPKKRKSKDNTNKETKKKKETIPYSSILSFQSGNSKLKKDVQFHNYNPSQDYSTN